MGLVRETIHDVELTLQTSEELFSPEQVDRGTLAMLSTITFQPTDKVLDLGCGYGVVGIVAARLIGPEQVVMVDVNPQAVQLAQYNAEANGVAGIRIRVSDGLASVEEGDFTLILSNPPYHEDFAVPKMFIEDGFAHLCVGGKMVMVVKRLTWYKNKLTTVFGGVKVDEIDDYYVLTAEKRTLQVQRKKEATISKKHQKRMEESAKRKKRFR